MAETGNSKKSGKRSSDRQRSRPPLLEWVAAAVGLTLTLAVLGALGWEGLESAGDDPPAIDAEIRRIVPVRPGYVVEVELRNRSSATAAAVQVEGELTAADGAVATSTATVDYVPGDSTRSAGLFFADDPRLHRLEVRALGYAEP
ncbi:hypothetical protein [Pelagerythrobacter rhizovicinus]|uniref:TIGR02588 family protein n=1 Tax=Pelagerythrobacter rhizovicinus TaxID=2268576 RepID=A0A4Q2KHH7_9SPHN|nr:hypothetical protein [Pelagerythrobacter rhizovicinus]RXZ64575.1 hypothetical protein ETX26_11860 [Pelagerythrobacter rhizovicinus]